MRLFISGFLAAMLAFILLAEHQSIRVTWTHAEKTVKYHGQTVLAVYPKRTL